MFWRKQLLHNVFLKVVSVGALSANSLDFFLRYETKSFPYNPERCVIYPSGESSGVRSGRDLSCDTKFLPSMEPIRIQAVWIPEGEGRSYGCDGVSHPFCRMNGDGRREVLFPIHPDSKELFGPLLNEFETNTIELIAYPLSSLRTLWVIVPGESEQLGTPWMVKTSLNKYSGGISRVLSERECALSVINTALMDLMGPELGMSRMRDVFSFVPDARFMDSRFLPVQTQSKNLGGGGMIVRPLPPELSPDSSVSVVPFFSLYNSPDLLASLLEASGKTVTQFFDEILLIPYADFLIRAMEERISIQAHPQNLLIKFNLNTLEVVGLMYRDMGGVNVCMTEERLRSLSGTLQEDRWHYTDTHLRDFAMGIEDHFVGNLLRNLTITLLHSRLSESDVEFQKWRQSEPYLDNWQKIISDEGGMLPQVAIPFDAYKRYGYFEMRFGQFFQKKLACSSVGKSVSSSFSYLAPRIASDYVFPDPCDQDGLQFFGHIMTVYGHFVSIASCENDTTV